MPQSFASTKRAPSRLWTGSIQSCRSRPEEPSDMVLSTTVTVRFRSTPRSTPRPARCWAKPHLVTPVAEFVAFLEQIVASLPQGQQIHIIADNLSAHRTIYVGDAPGEPGPDFPGDQVLDPALQEHHRHR